MTAVLRAVCGTACMEFGCVRAFSWNAKGRRCRDGGLQQASARRACPGRWRPAGGRQPTRPL